MLLCIVFLKLDSSCQSFAGAGSDIRRLRAKCQQPAASSQEPGARSQEPGARSQEPGARSQRPRQRGRIPRMRIGPPTLDLRPESMTLRQFHKVIRTVLGWTDDPLQSVKISAWPALRRSRRGRSATSHSGNRADAEPNRSLARGTVRFAQLGIGDRGEYIPDCYQIAMRVQNLEQMMIKGRPHTATTRATRH